MICGLTPYDCSEISPSFLLICVFFFYYLLQICCPVFTLIAHETATFHCSAVISAVFWASQARPVLRGAQRRVYSRVFVPQTLLPTRRCAPCCSFVSKCWRICGGGNLPRTPSAEKGLASQALCLLGRSKLLPRML